MQQHPLEQMAALAVPKDRVMLEVLRKVVLQAGRPPPVELTPMGRAMVRELPVLHKVPNQPLPVEVALKDTATVQVLPVVHKAPVQAEKPPPVEVILAGMT